MFITYIKLQAQETFLTLINTQIYENIGWKNVYPTSWQIFKAPIAHYDRHRFEPNTHSGDLTYSFKQTRDSPFVRRSYLSSHDSFTHPFLSGKSERLTFKVICQHKYFVIMVHKRKYNTTEPYWVYLTKELQSRSSLYLTWNINNA